MMQSISSCLVAALAILGCAPSGQAGLNEMSSDGENFSTVREFRRDRPPTPAIHDAYRETRIDPDGTLVSLLTSSPSREPGRGWYLHVSPVDQPGTFREIETLPELDYESGRGDRFAFHPSGVWFVGGFFYFPANDLRYGIIRVGSEAQGFRNSSAQIIEARSPSFRTVVYSRQDLVIDARGRVFWVSRSEDTPGMPRTVLLQLDCSATSSGLAGL